VCWGRPERRYSIEWCTHTKTDDTEDFTRGVTDLILIFHKGTVTDESVRWQDTVTDESVKWAGENVLPSRPQTVLLVEIIHFKINFNI
jgi:hypothetical protein